MLLLFCAALCHTVQNFSLFWSTLDGIIENFTHSWPTRFWGLRSVVSFPKCGAPAADDFFLHFIRHFYAILLVVFCPFCKLFGSVYNTETKIIYLEFVISYVLRYSLADISGENLLNDRLRSPLTSWQCCSCVVYMHTAMDLDEWTDELKEDHFCVVVADAA